MGKCSAQTLSSSGVSSPGGRGGRSRSLGSQESQGYLVLPCQKNKIRAFSVGTFGKLKSKYREGVYLLVQPGALYLEASVTLEVRPMGGCSCPLPSACLNI